ncbi:MAG TPA: hypothetical protein VLG48_01670 [Candidatus Methylomirabilis sp.]|nr:hypothetical protein [Candidatus Methylomirabilis sp.]
MAFVIQAIAGVVVASVAIVGGMYLIRADRKSRRPTEIERGLIPIYTERGGARLDAFNWTIPFVRIATYKDFVVISCATHEIILRRGDVTGIERERHFFFPGLRLRHVRPQIPSELILWPRHAARLEAALRESLLA